MKRLVRIGAVVAIAATTITGAAHATTATSPEVTRSKVVSRVHWVDGADQQVDRRTVTATVSATQDLRDRQAITVTWKNAHPTAGLVTDHNSAAASLQEYPVVIMQCRGVDSADAPAAKRVTPETCWTQTPDERFQYTAGYLYPAYRMDRYAATEDRAYAVGQPDPLPDGCRGSSAAVPHWVPFRAVDGTVYPGGPKGCGGVAPEASETTDALQPSNTTYGVADRKGAGSAKFIVQTAETNASVGCSATVACTLEIIPIEGISCDAAGTASDAADRGMTPNTRPAPSFAPTVFADCSKTGHFAPGAYNGGGETPDLTVSGQLWWSASNWRNRISVPLSFAPSASVCDVVTDADTQYLYGSEAMLQATQQWAPHFCLDPSLYVLRHVQTSEPQAKNLLNAGAIDAAVQGAPPAQPFGRPTVQAPIALSGFAIAYSVDGADGNPYRGLRLDARLLAKLLSESYRSCALDCLDFTSDDAKKSGFAKLATNPIDLSRDPEFAALNPGIPRTNYLQAAATLAVMSSDSDVMHALTSYVDADPEAREWLNGVPDPWGMVVNPAYKGIDLPLDSWPLLDTHVAHFTPGANQCLERSPVPWLPLVASPVSNPASIALNMQFDISNSQVNCKDNGAQTQKLAGLGRQSPGERFLLGLVSLADAARYQLPTATLQTQNSSTDQGEFGDAAGRSFAAADAGGLRAAAAMLTADDHLGTWVLPYDELRSTPAGKAAYPGTMLMSVDLPTSGLGKADAARYATFLRFAAGPGQRAGLGIGELPPGYLPLTAGNGLAALSRYSDLAADYVQRQSGTVPTPSDPKALPPPARPSSSAPAPGTSTSSAPPAPGTSSSAASSSTPSTSAKPRPTPSATLVTTPPASKVARTEPLTVGPLDVALPVLAVVGLICLGVAGWTSGAGRRR